jgi:hypothetical protein
MRQARPPFSQQSIYSKRINDEETRQSLYYYYIRNRRYRIDPRNKLVSQLVCCTVEFPGAQFSRATLWWPFSFGGLQREREKGNNRLQTRARPQLLSSSSSLAFIMTRHFQIKFVLLHTVQVTHMSQRGEEEESLNFFFHLVTTGNERKLAADIFSWSRDICCRLRGSGHSVWLLGDVLSAR